MRGLHRVDSDLCAVIPKLPRRSYVIRMSFFDLFLVFTLATVGFYHVVLGGTGILTGSSVVYPMPYMLNRPALYLLVAGTLGWNWVYTQAGPTVAYPLFVLLLADLIYETVHPLLAASVEVLGVEPKDIERDLLDSFAKMGLRYAGSFPEYRVLEPYARIRVRHHKQQGTAEVRMYPRSRRRLLEEIACAIAKDRDAVEVAHLQRGYLVTLIVGVILILVALVRAGMLIR
jgi:hypothetical protein